MNNCRYCTACALVYAILQIPATAFTVSDRTLLMFFKPLQNVGSMAAMPAGLTPRASAHSENVPFFSSAGLSLREKYCKLSTGVPRCKRHNAHLGRGFRHDGQLVICGAVA
ncbi:hypothetical protein DFJ77DRAFT_193976 [Powellomyces hirtus]|nr:hypothetical protein DFJ77DRAFT_193976 [Powellomyces hirtus]